MVRYSDELLEEIKSSNDIVDIISQYVALKRSGRNFFGLCPFHREKSPSFSVSPDKQIFHCFGCGAGGNVIHFVQKIENLDFKEALELLAEKSGIQLPTYNNAEDNQILALKDKVYEINKVAAQFYHDYLYNGPAKLAQEYVKKRRLDNNTLKTFLIGYSPADNDLYKYLVNQKFKENEILASSLVIKTEAGKCVDRFKRRLMFPISDVRGKIIAFGGRILDDSKPKYINSSENIVYSKGKHLYALNVAKKQVADRIVVVEGYMDAVSLHQRGVTNVVASLGTALTESQGRLLRKTSEKVIIGYDSDEAGQAATLRGLEILNTLGCDVRILQMEGAKDPDEFIIKYGSERFNKLLDKAISLIEFRVKVLKNSLNITTVQDKIKFLNEIAKILSKVENKIELELYMDKMSKEYEISKEAIYAEINKLKYGHNKGSKVLESRTQVKIQKKQNINTELTKPNIEREKMLISLLFTEDNQVYQKIKDKITDEDFKLEQNKKIVKKMYDVYKNGNINVSSILDNFTEQDDINYVTEIMSENYEISDTDKFIENFITKNIKERLQQEKEQILNNMKNDKLTKEEIAGLDNALSDIIAKLAIMK